LPIGPGFCPAAVVRVGQDVHVTSVVIIGGGPGGYEAALVAAQLGARTTLIESGGIGGSAVLTDCVPSKALVAVADAARETVDSAGLGVLVRGGSVHQDQVSVDLATVNDRILRLAGAQSQDIAARLVRDGVRIIAGQGVLVGASRVLARTDQDEELLDADVVLLATGARPRILETARPDGVRILNWEQVYNLTEVPERLIVVGSGVTGAEFASAYRGLGAEVTLVSSRDHVLPGSDADAARVLEGVFARRGIEVLSRSRAEAAQVMGDEVEVSLQDGRRLRGSHCLMAVGSVPNTEEIGLVESGVRLSSGGFIDVDRVSRTSLRGVYAAGDCTGVMMLASVAAMQGRIAMWHALGDAVAPLDLATVASNIFTTPEIATVGASEAQIAAGQMNAETVILPLGTNARAKMTNFDDGFVKLFARRGTRIVVGGVVVAPGASELIHAGTIAVEQRLTVDEVAQTFTVYPSLSGSIAEAARRLHVAESPTD